MMDRDRLHRTRNLWSYGPMGFAARVVSLTAWDGVGSVDLDRATCGYWVLTMRI